MSEKQELLHRAKAKQKELESELETLKAKGHNDATEKKQKLQSRIEELKDGIDEAQDKYTEKIAGKINQWLA